MFDINRYQGNYAMHCATEEEAKDFCKYLHEHGRTWRNGTIYIGNTYWFRYEADTAYSFNQCEFATANYYKKMGYTILEWSDFMNKPFTKSNLKNGDVVLYRNKTVGIVITDLEVIVQPNGYVRLDSIEKDLTNIINHDYDIVSVRRPFGAASCGYKAFEHDAGQLVYEHEEVEEMTLEQVCKLLGKNIKIIK